ncbi:hypothetical protein HMPREF1210_01177 [Paenisporosarcina sp. HGH0030]|uniref:hypothetical protein n=1 Tax=Paenisporosarcina sp. HGH0030 TaxID=1078085 RepID=UPI00034ECF1A|nr:hypothetical protein [Paenisporosarcina sp. HGH0030]EPD52797.1 hypothetical protein HMPREF1210_01177 [Paenisporosarcina sp. HGH0030]
MTSIPNVNLMREMAQEKTAVFNEEFAKSEIFAKMCADIQVEANKGNFSKLFSDSGFGGHKSITAAHDLFLKHGYSVTIKGWNLVVSWGRNKTVDEENE